jgi:hypothetical protein
MRKQRISLILLQLLASTIVMMAEANTGRYEFKTVEKELSEERDPEIETSRERDVFPDLLGFASHFYQ